MSLTLKSGILFFSCLLAFAKANAQADTTKIKTAFDQLKTALVEENAKAALAAVDSNSLAFYSNIFKLAKEGDSLQVEGLPIYEKALVFAVRAKGQKQNPVTLKDSAFFMYAVNNRLVDKMGMPLSGGTLGNITVTGNEATAPFMVFNTQLPYKVRFHKQRNKWKTDITSLVPVSNELFKNMASGSGKTETRYLLSIISLSGNAVDENVLWQPLEK